MNRFFVLLVLFLVVASLQFPTITQASDLSENEQCCVCICQVEPYIAPSSEPESNNAVDLAENHDSDGSNTESEPENSTPNENNPEIQLNLAINELFPNPEGLDSENEFIEIINNGSTEVNLKDWTVQVGSKQFKLEQNTYLPALSIKYWLYLETKLTLTNTGNTVKLVEPNGTEHDVVTYPGPAKTGQTYAKNDSELWEWTTLPTPGQNNAFPVTLPVELIPTDSELNSNQDSDPLIPTETPIEPTPVADNPITPNADLVINEFLPDPEGSDSAEWVELWNCGQTTAYLTGWILDDMEGGSKPFDLSENHLEPGGFLLINMKINCLIRNISIRII